ncbi:tryptophan halogenase family protein [Paucibacter sp. DJ2R-2]|uniref:tryptophan halogenase family protein n=1 Tax=Paucibacter sp. DJ2R-2 TaxID=2893558 RepID=UPI0021E37E91|nr:tryptophan halogenase family protein [Paucibacter sp. DJ2R-2]MCV2422313.1 tryptophan 7-halogenase [Paucibacter sp. DJ4R-1]MCV2440535.1 tryptophan 7-halogenase [Paucibacter sp. DJ2R-2]
MSTPSPAAAPHFVIVGGGTAGWMTACLLARQLGPACRYTLVESSEIGTIGVGEGSTPYLRDFFRQLGLEERDWMPACHATYKAGIRFPGWSTQPGYESYVHPFFNEADRPLGQAFIQQANLRRRGEDVDANPADFFLAAELARQRRAPVYGQPEHSPATDYAYHFDSGLLGAFLKRHGREQLGLQHCVDTVAAVERHAETGDIMALRLQDSGQRLEGDFFIDCSGFRGLLINETLGEPFIPWGDRLFNDRAIAIPTPLEPEQDISSETTSTALGHGWAWQIPLSSRYGNGYVYSSDFISDDAAEAALRAHLGPAAEGANARRLKMRVGRVARHWRHNCVAIGLSQGFIEPLEATALMLIQFSVQHLIEALQSGGGSGTMEDLRQRYNAQINQMFDGVLEYVQTHYLLNTRDDSDYWRANRALKPCSERLAELLRAWDQGGDFDAVLSRHEAALMYQRPSWYCLLAGMGRFPASTATSLALPAPAIALSGLQARASLMDQTRRFFMPHREALARLGPGQALGLGNSLGLNR